jgi:hypothetical protein
VNMPSTDDWMEWALSTPIPSRAVSIGQSSTRLILVALALHANAEGFAFPSAQTIADKINGMHRRDVRNALEVLEAGGVIARAGKVGRAVRWHLNSLDKAGFPATSHSRDMAGYPANDVAGNMAGNVAGNLAGYPAPNRTEQKIPPTPQSDQDISRSSARRRDVEQDLILQQLAAADLDINEARAVMEYALHDKTTTTTPRRRLQQPGYLARCREAVRAFRATAYGAGAKCEDHPTEIGENCRSCQADRKVGERDLRYVGKHQPQCSVCLDPLVNYPLGATTCDAHTEAVSA